MKGTSEDLPKRFSCLWSVFLSSIVFLTACSGSQTGSSGPCGNGVIDPGEMCDFGIAPGQPGGCPGYENCDDDDVCTADSLLQPSTCLARCSHRMLASCSRCGDGRVQVGENCDTAIAAGLPGACPSSCNDRVSCTADRLDGTGCMAQCIYDAITAIGPMDGCCPQGAVNNTDQDCSASCGNSMVETGETCDTGIASGAGACPTLASCNDNNGCTVDGLVSMGTCMAECTRATITMAGPMDGCCPAGVNNNNTDPDCPVMCGNGVREMGELCDTGVPAGMANACPTVASCNDNMACTADVIVGTGCQSVCNHSPITTCVHNDGCCPTACNMTNDNDCMAVCGNGVREAGELCDTTIPVGMPNACPTMATCNDSNVCTADTINGMACQAVCNHTNLTAGPMDGCCPAGANNNTDPDCAVMCGNGVREAGELCDTTIPQGMTDACPTMASCVRGTACTNDSITGAMCQAACNRVDITMCANGDGCCPSTCNMVTDSDCMAVCGNGVREGAELCDTTIPMGMAGACPTVATCNDSMACTADSVTGTACQQACAHTAITACAGGDGCCPAGCNMVNDGDCTAMCANGVLEAGELCDTTIPMGMAGACPTLASCNDNMACTADSVTGMDCQQQCLNTAIATCINGDGCCPAGGICTMATDDDCPP